MGHDHRSLGIEGQGQRSSLGVLVQNAPLFCGGTNQIDPQSRTVFFSWNIVLLSMLIATSLFRLGGKAGGGRDTGVLSSTTSYHKSYSKGAFISLISSDIVSPELWGSEFTMKRPSLLWFQPIRMK